MNQFRRDVLLLLSSTLAAGTVLTLANAASISTAAASGPTVGWSSAYYVAWQQSSSPPATLPWSDFSVLIHFSIKTSSARNGSLNTTTHGMSPANMQAAVAAAHQHGKSILLSVGGSDDLNWDAACSAPYRTTFINNLVGLMRQYGYNGLDLDVEQSFSQTDFVACIAGVRGALNGISPRPMLTEPADPNTQPAQVAPVAGYLDQLNLMSYNDSLSMLPAEVAKYTSRGVPLSRIGIGLGLAAGNVDTSLASCQAKTAYAASNGFGGVMEWTVTETAAPPCMNVVGGYLAGAPAPTPPPTSAPTPTSGPTPAPTSTQTSAASPLPSILLAQAASHRARANAAGTPSANPNSSSSSGPAVALRPSGPTTADASLAGSPQHGGSLPYPLFALLGLGVVAAAGFARWRFASR